MKPLSAVKNRTVVFIVLLILQLAANRSHAVVGTLQIDGESVSKVILQDHRHCEQHHVISDSNTVLEVGQHTLMGVHLVGGYEWRQWASNDKITIEADEAAVLKAGGPLKQTVDVKRTGNMLSLTYSVTGIAGRQYTNLAQEYRPYFTIRAGDRLIATESFAYG